MSGTVRAMDRDVAELVGETDVESLDAQRVIATMLEALNPEVALACSFQKEESVLLDMLLEHEPKARVFALDTHYLFPETYELWREIEQRYGIRSRGVRGPVARAPGRDARRRALGAQPRPLLAIRKVGRSARALGGLDGWITGVRRDQSPTRADAPKLGWDDRARALEGEPARRLDATTTSGRTSASAGCPSTRSTSAATLRSAARTAPPPAPAARAAGPAAARPSAGCTPDEHERDEHDRPVRLSHLDELEAEAIHIMREVAAELERPVLLFSGGKDSIVLLRLAEKAFRPGEFPFPLMHVDTGHNFPEVIEFRDRRVAELGERLVVASVQESIDKGRVVEETGPRASRNQLQTTTLLDAIEEHGFDAAIGGARRDEERARAKERIFSFRDDFGQWNPRAQRPELWNLYNGRIRKGEQVRVFPISNWTELDVWQYIAREQLELPPIYFAHEREVFKRDGMLYARREFVERLAGEEPFIEPRSASARSAT